MQTPKPNEQNQKRKTNLTADTYTELFFGKLTALQLKRRPGSTSPQLQSTNLLNLFLFLRTNQLRKPTFKANFF